MPKSGNKTVLIVDDAAFIRNRIKRVVEKIEYAEVIGEAANGDDAITLYKELNPDLVTMDLIMPEADGIKAIEEIMKIDNKATIVVVSAIGQEVTVADALEKISVGDKTSAPKIIEVLLDQEWKKRQSAARALSRRTPLRIATGRRAVRRIPGEDRGLRSED